MSNIAQHCTKCVNPLTAKFPTTSGRIAEFCYTNYPIHKTTWKPWIKTLAIDYGTQLCCLCLHINNHNEVIKEQSLKFSKNPPETTVSLELTFHKGALQL